MEWYVLVFLFLGFLAGVAGGFLGIGGGMLMVPFMVFWGVPLTKAVGSSLLAIVLLSISGTIRNRKTGTVMTKKSVMIALGACIFAPVGAKIINPLPENISFIIFGLFCISQFILMKCTDSKTEDFTGFIVRNSNLSEAVSRIFIGACSGLTAGFFGVGGGAVMVPFQVLFLGDDIKHAIRVSLAVIIPTTLAGLVMHFYLGNVLLAEGILLGIGGILGAQLGTKLLVHASASLARKMFQVFLICIATYYVFKGFS